MASPQYCEETIRQSRKLFGFAVGRNPKETYVDCGSPQPSRLAAYVTMYVIDQFQEAHSETIDTRTRKLFFNGIEDVNTIFDRFLRDLEPKEAEDFIVSPETCREMAMIALRPDDDETTGIRLIMDMRSDQYRRVVDFTNKSHPQLRSLPPDSERGCPFAGEAGEVHIDPLFARFVPWAGVLSLTALRHHGLIKK